MEEKREGPRLRAHWLLAGVVGLSACAGVPGRGVPSHHALDSASAQCVRDPVFCALLNGKTIAIGSVLAVGAGASVGVALKVLDDRARLSLKKEMEECADQARTDVLLQHGGVFARPVPSPAECKRLTVDAQGRSVTWAIRLGLEMHEAALRCAQMKLERIRPGGFSLEPRYRFNRETKEKELISPEEKAALLRQGGEGLKGTLEPDVVIHSGDPLQIQVVFDFKFRCVNFDEAPKWREYPEGHHYAGFSQGRIYREAFGEHVELIGPRTGVFR